MSQIDRIPITDRGQWLALRRKFITASDVPAVCGHGLYGSPVKVWAEKRGLLPEQEMTAVLKRGLWGEAAVFEALAWERPDLELRRAKVFLADHAARLGATPDGAAIDPSRSGIGIVQAKVIAARVFRSTWLADPAADPHDVYADATPPLAYELQTLTEGMLGAADWMMLAVLIVDEYRWTLRTFDVPRHAEAEQMIRAQVLHFWQTYLDPGVQPPIDGERDAAVIKALFPIDHGTTIDLSGDNRIGALVDQWTDAKAKRSASEDAAEEAATEIKGKLGEHAFGLLPDGRMLTFKSHERKAFTVPASTVRQLRVKKLRG